MHPQRELSLLLVHKAALRRAIARQRGEIVAAGTRVFQPLQLFDRCLAFVRPLRLASIAAAPLGDLLMRTVFPRQKVLGACVRWGPVVFAAVRSLSSPRPGR